MRPHPEAVTGFGETRGEVGVTGTNSPKVDLALEISHGWLAEGATANRVGKRSCYRRHFWDTRTDDKDNLFLLGL